MPKQVDHDQRRREIVEALWRIAADRGLEGVSMREVATEAGISIGRVQHYFASKDRMVEYATYRLREHIEQRVQQNVGAAPQPHTPLRILRAILVALLPLDPESRTGSRVGIAVFIRALNEPGLAGKYRHGQRHLAAAVADQIRAAIATGELRADLDPDVEAHILLALASGLSSDLLLDFCSADQALMLLDHQLARLT